MSDITELERRITAALDRIGAGIDGLQEQQPAGPDPEMVAKLEAAQASVSAAQASASAAQAQANASSTRIAELEQTLETEGAAKAELEAYLTQKSEEAENATMRAKVELLEQQKTTARLDTELQRLRAAAEGLRSSNISLRASLEAGQSDPHLINASMVAELETLRATRSVEIAQADAVLASLEPLVARAAHEANAPDKKENSDA